MAFPLNKHIRPKIIMLHTALAWDVSAIPESGLTDIEFFQPSKDDHTCVPPPSVSSLPMVSQQTNPQPGEPPLINQKSTIEAHHDNLPSSKPAPVIITHPSTSVKEKSRLQQHPVCLFNLSTITEESGSYKSSSSGSFVYADVKPDNFMLKDLWYNSTSLSMTLYFFSL